MTSLAGQSNLVQHRQSFPALGNKFYFNYGGQGPLPQPALAAISQTYRYFQQEGPFTAKALAWITQQVEQTRVAIAQELDVSPTTLSLTDSVSTGCNIALWGVNWQSGDHLLLTDCEHPSVVATAQLLQRRFSIEVSSAPLMATLNQGDPIAAIIEQLRPSTKMVVVSHVLWNTGQVLPLAALVQACRQINPEVLVVVDAAQSVGVLPLNLDVLDVDCYAFTGHKWWCGPEGLGALYVNPKVFDRLEPTFIGWRGIEKNEAGYPTGWQPDGRRFEVATAAFPLCSGLKAAIEHHHAWETAQERHQRILTLSQLLWSQLCEIPAIQCLRTAPPEAGLVSFQVNHQDHGRFVRHLEMQGMMVRLIEDPNCVRACVHYLTLESEVMTLVEAIAIALQ